MLLLLFAILGGLAYQTHRASIRAFVQDEYRESNRSHRDDEDGRGKQPLNQPRCVTTTPVLFHGLRIGGARDGCGPW